MINNTYQASEILKMNEMEQDITRRLRSEGYLKSNDRQAVEDF